MESNTGPVQKISHIKCSDSDRFSFDQVGTYSELLANEGAFSEFLKTFAAEQNVEEDGR